MATSHCQIEESECRPQHASTPIRSSQQKKWKNRPLRILNQNINSVIGKRVELENVIDSLKPDIIILTETKINDNIQDPEFIDDNAYKIFRKDRNREGGGVLIAISRKYDSIRVSELETECEIVWAKVTIKGRNTLYVCAYYRPDISDEASLEQFDISLARATGMNNAYLIIGGDLNFPSWHWPTMSLKEYPRYPKLHHNFINLLADHGLEQVVLEPTRGDNTLDLFITNHPQLVPRVEVRQGLSDHDLVYCEFNIYPQKKKQQPRQIPNYNQADWESMKSSVMTLNDNLEKMSKTNNTEELWVYFKNFLQDIITKFIPHKTLSGKVHKPWITRKIRTFINQRDRAYKKKKKTGTQEAKEHANYLRRKVQRMMRQSYWDYLNNIFEEENSLKNNRNKKFWAYIKHRRSTRPGVAPLKKDGKLYYSPSMQSAILNQQFQSAFSEGKDYTAEEFLQKTGMQPLDIPPMEEILISEEGVKKQLHNLNPYKATGPDGIGPRVLKELADELAPAIATLFRSSLSSGEIPSDWRDALVTPIFKKGEQYDPANYRPVSLTCVLCKIMEHILVTNIMHYLDLNNILSDRQHGFRRGRSCETQLLEFIDELVGYMEGGGQADVLIMDFAKAFDKCNHSLLIHKLKAYGIQGKANRWIQSFLSNRRQAVVVDGVASSFVSVQSGVPQGSVLGPALFLVYINDLPVSLDKSVRLFADDTAVYSKVKTRIDQDQLQADLDRLADWEGRWDMQFHPAKCNTLRCTQKHKPLIKDYTLHGHTLSTVQSAKYLGVTLHHKMDWDNHVNAICSKANSALGFLRRNLKVSSPSIRERAYKAFVRPLLEYAPSVWDPYELKHKVAIERVQRRAARFVLNRYHNTSSVSTMLDTLAWKPLEQRRKAARLTAFYKINNNLMHCINLKSQLKPSTSRNRRHGHNKQYLPLSCKTNYRSGSFLPRTIPEWNALPQDTIEAETPDSFMSRVSQLPS